MATQLHIVTRKEDALSKEIVSLQQAQPESSTVIADLTIGAPDYKRLLEQIFAADSVTVW
jgi:hypothetical protein